MACEEPSKKKVVSVHIWNVHCAEMTEILKHTRGPQIRREIGISRS